MVCYDIAKRKYDITRWNFEDNGEKMKLKRNKIILEEKKKQREKTKRNPKTKWRSKNQRNSGVKLRSENKK
jgi:hypothetical protein